MKKLVMLLLCALGLNVANAQAQESGEFWIPTKLKWTRISGAPKGHETARAIVFYFPNKGRRFVRDECWLIRNGKSLSISNGDPHDEYVGETEPILDGMRLRYRLVSRTVTRNGESLPGDVLSEDASTLAVSGLEVSGHFFRRISPENAGEYEAGYKALLARNF